MQILINIRHSYPLLMRGPLHIYRLVLGYGMVGMIGISKKYAIYASIYISNAHLLIRLCFCYACRLPNHHMKDLYSVTSLIHM